MCALFQEGDDLKETNAYTAGRWRSQAALSRDTGAIVPVFFSQDTDEALIAELLHMTLSDCYHYMPLDHVYVVVDGDARSEAVARGLRDEFLQEHNSTFRLLPREENGGKLAAMRDGARALLDEQPGVCYLAVLDGDGDHLASVVPQLVRTAQHVMETRGTERIIAIGARRSRHRPMGWLRGELEAFLDAVTLDALVYRLAREGRVLERRYLLCHQMADLSSGFKVYGRGMAHYLFVEQAPNYQGFSLSDYWHYGPETVTIVEATLAGGFLAELLRPTWDGQPTSSFNDFGVLDMYGELLAWVFARLHVPLSSAAGLFDNRVPGLSLRTTADGRELLAALRERVLRRLAGEDPGADLSPSWPLPPFV